MRTDRSDAISDCMASAEHWLDEAKDRDNGHAERAIYAAIAGVRVQMAQVHVAMQEWPIEEEPA